MRKNTVSKQQKAESRGFIIPAILSLMVALSIITGAVVVLIDSNFGLVANNIKSQQAFNIAEAGINYYLWHLSHNATDYRDGKTTPVTPDPLLGYGPYVHNYINASGVNEGSFKLYINPGTGSSTIVKVRSTGTVAGSTVSRTIEAQIGAPSFASYAVTSDDQLWFGNTETANGPIHSNQGIRMDGPSNTDVTAANATYVPDGSYGGDGASHPGVWCHPSVTAPVNCNTRSKADWRYPVPSIDFNQVSGTLCTIKKLAFSADAVTASLANLSNACSQVPTTRTAAYLPQRATNGSYNIARGYLIQLNPDGTYNLSQVNAENDKTTVYTSALTLSSIANNIAIPASGVIYAEDNVWIRSNPTYTGRVTIAAGRLATSNGYGNIVVADDLAYGTKNGTVAVGLIAQDSVLIAPYAVPTTSSFTFEVNAAMLAQNGTVGYPARYRADNSATEGWTSSNQIFNFYGSVATRQNWTWTIQWGGASGNNTFDPVSGYYISGVLNNTTQYDYSLLYGPPPSYPITSSYNVLSWREVLVVP